MRVLPLLLLAAIVLSPVVGCGTQKVREAGARSPTKGAAQGTTSDKAVGSDWGDAKIVGAIPDGTSGTVSPGGDKKMAGWAKDKDKAFSPAKDAAAKDGPSSKGVPTKIPELAPAVPPTSPAAVADAIAGTAKPAKKPQEPALPSGVLTAGSFDDNIDPRAFQSFLKKMSQQPGLQDIPTRMAGQRLLIRVKDAADKPVGGAKVQLVATTGQAAELTTRTDGRVVFLSSFDNLPTDVALTATVTPLDGGAPVTEKIEAGAVRWDITLPAAVAKMPKNLDLAIVLDTTGSMGKELEYLKAELRGISKLVHDRFPEVQQRFALVVYRDDDDEYVAKHYDFASLDVFHKRLSEQRAADGGDIPEAVHRGFEEANQLRWRSSEDTARVMFWIADAPPHAQHMNRTMSAANAIRKQGIAMYPVACGTYDDPCEVVMRSCALLTGAQFLFLTDDSGIGGSHAEPKIPYYHVERLERLMVRMVAGELAGQRIDVNPADVIRTVGKKVN